MLRIVLLVVALQVGVNTPKLTSHAPLLNSDCEERVSPCLEQNRRAVSAMGIVVVKLT